MNCRADQVEPPGQHRFPVGHVINVAKFPRTVSTEHRHRFIGARLVKGWEDEQALGHLVRRPDEGDGPRQTGAAHSADAAQGTTNRPLLHDRCVIGMTCVVFVGER